MCKPDIDLVLDVHPVERPARAYRNTSRAPRGRCLDPHVQVFLLDEHLGQGRYPILTTTDNKGYDGVITDAHDHDATTVRFDTVPARQRAPMIVYAVY